ncbi:alpha/beta hydrolase [Actinomadura macra]|uniref:alpha/beta hydrolase n=1 Tax=Actinomadura macra TaxID=46164 RepID=UPI00082D6178|nr:alpha/beta hydrolase [Actinomadura macra]
MNGVELLAIPMQTPAAADQIYSGVARQAGVLWATRHRAAPGRLADTVVVVVHPSSNFLGHYALPWLAAEGADAVGMTTRYIGNDSALLLENCVLDVGSVVRHLRNEGYRQVVLMGNSGGGGLVALYQEQAENPTITGPPGGGPPDLTAADLPPADALVLAMAHPGRAGLLTEWLDPAVVDEHDPTRRDDDLDMFRPRNGPPYAPGFLAAYRAAQQARNDRITAWASDRLDRLSGPADLPFLVHGTCADPRFLDLDIDPSDREPGTLWGDAYAANLQPTGLAHFTTLRSWLSQWSRTRSNGHGPLRLRGVGVPVHVIYGTADQGCFPSHARELFDAVPHDRRTLTAIHGGRHYLNGRPDLARRLAEIVLDRCRGADTPASTGPVRGQAPESEPATPPARRPSNGT